MDLFTRKNIRARKERSVNESFALIDMAGRVVAVPFNFMSARRSLDTGTIRTTYSSSLILCSPYSLCRKPMKRPPAQVIHVMPGAGWINYRRNLFATDVFWKHAQRMSLKRLNQNVNGFRFCYRRSNASSWKSVHHLAPTIKSSIKQASFKILLTPQTITLFIR